MQYRVIVRKKQGRLVMLVALREVEEGRVLEPVEIGGDIILFAGPL
ncbi:MAG: hypothetical protein P8X58_08715 [Syntrophobacterales bacterium]